MSSSQRKKPGQMAPTNNMFSMSNIKISGMSHLFPTTTAPSTSKPATVVTKISKNKIVQNGDDIDDDMPIHTILAPSLMPKSTNSRTTAATRMTLLTKATTTKTLGKKEQQQDEKHTSTSAVEEAIPTPPVVRHDLFDRAHEHMEKIAVADERFEHERQQRMQNLKLYDKVHQTDAAGKSGGDGSLNRGTSLKHGMISNNFVRTNLKRKTRRFTRRIPKKRKFADSASSMNEEQQRAQENGEDVDNNSSSSDNEYSADENNEDNDGVGANKENRKIKSSTSVKKMKKKSNDNVSDNDSNSSSNVHISAESIDRILNSSRETSEPELRSIAKQYFGFESLREGQLETTLRIVHGKSTLTILPTGLGKSFCYQLAALIMTSKHFKSVPSDTRESHDDEDARASDNEHRNKLVIVVSPLISLMSDQMRQLPDCLPGEFLTASQTKSQRSAVLDRIRNGHVRILFISPERLASDQFLHLLVSSNCRIAFACVDEAHCVSEWSHNFRPSYLHIQRALKQFDVHTILALTATATKSTERDICNRLFGSESPEHVIRGSVCRDNLILSSSRVRSSDERFAEVTKLLRSKPFCDSESIIIYTTTKNEADLLCQHLQIHMKDVPGAVKSYHAGMQASTRNTIQKQFISNDVRIIVATVAFGMGINKHDVRSVIHFSLPRSIENYVQEVGRAGRDGIVSPCHLFLCDEDAIRLRSLVYGERVSEIDIKRFLQHLFAKEQGEFLSGVPELEQELDMPSTVIKTLLTHIELLETTNSPMIHINANCKNRYTVSFHATHPTQLAQGNKLVSAILRVKSKATKNGQHVFDIASICQETGKTSIEVERELEALQDSGEIKYTATDEAFCVDIHRAPSSEQRASLAKVLFSKMRDLEQNTLWKLDEMYKLAYRSAHPSLGHLQEENNRNAEQRSTEQTEQQQQQQQQQQRSIQDQIELYFTAKSSEPSTSVQSALVALDLVKTMDMLDDSSLSIIKRDVSSLLSKHDMQTLSNGKIIARIFHGLSSPGYGAAQWTQSGVWGRYRNIDFPTLESLCTKVLISYKQNSH